MLIGKSNWLTDGYSSLYLDDLRFFNKSLNQEEIIQLMKQNGTCEFLKKNTFLYNHRPRIKVKPWLFFWELLSGYYAQQCIFFQLFGVYFNTI